MTTTTTETKLTELRNIADRINDPEVFFVSLADAAAFLGIAKSTAYASYHATGFLVDGVPIRKSGQRRYLVATAHIRALSDPATNEVE